jgi:chromosome segregation ATPase
MEIGGLQRQLMQRDARIRDLETLHAAAAQAVVDAGKENDALRLQVQNRQNKCEQQKGRIGFLETLNAGNDAAISDYRTQVEKLHRLLDTARGQLEAAASEISEQLAAIDAADKQLDQKDAQIRDLRIELDAAQQVPRPVSDDERERIWDDATEQAGRQVIRWLKPLTLALNRQPDERFSRFMALTLSILPDVVPELLGYAVEDGAEGDCEE